MAIQFTTGYTLFIGIVAAIISVIVLWQLYIGKIREENKVAAMPKFIFGILFLGLLFFGLMEMGVLAGISASLSPLVFGGKVTPTGPTACTNICAAGQSQKPYPDCSCYTPALVTAGEICTVDTTTVTLGVHDAFDAATSVGGGGSHRVFLNGADKGYVTDGSTFSASPGDKYRIIFALNGSTTAAGNYYYARQVTGTIPCKGTFLIPEESTGLCVAGNGTTITVWLQDGSVMTDSNLETLEANSHYEWPFRIKAPSSKCVGNIYDSGTGNVLCINYNNTALKKLDVTNQNTAGVPQAESNLAAKGNSSVCFYVPTLANSQQQDFTLAVDTGSINPSDTNMTMNLYDVATGINTKTLATITDVQDNNLNDLGYNTTASVNTAAALVSKAINTKN